MILNEIFEQLFFGELSQTNIGVSTGLTSAMAEADYPRIINFLNRAVLAIHKKFVLLEKETVFQMIDGVNDYILHDRYATTNVEDISPETKYIIDSVDNPFSANRPLKVLEIFNEAGEPFLLNPTHITEAQQKEMKGLFAYTPSSTKIQVPYPASENSIFVIMQATPNNIPTDTTDITTIVEAPEVFLEPILIHIADTYFSGMSQNKPEAQVYPNKFLAACKQIEDANLTTVDHLMGRRRFRGDGWQ